MSFRTDRISSEIRKCVSVIIRDKLRNPDVSPMTTVYVSVLGDSGRTVQSLNAAAGFIRHELSCMLRSMRTVPSLSFKTDSSVEYGMKIDSILKEISENESDLRGD